MSTSKTTREPEYRCIIAPHANERLQKTTTRVTLETTQAFASFRYELSVRHERKDRVLRFKILGLKTPQLDFPSSGTAHSVHEFEDLKGKFRIEVEGLDRDASVCEVNITQNQIKIVKQPTASFIEFIVP